MVQKTTQQAVEVISYKTFFSKITGRNWNIDIYLPLGFKAGQQYKWLIANDGQDMKAIKLAETLFQLQHEGNIEPILIAAIHAPYDRKQVYGVASEVDFKYRGSQAANYARVIAEEVLPFLLSKYQAMPQQGCIMGFSLGGLQAFDIAWHRPDLFNRVGVFSGSFWWRRKGYDQGYTNTDRIMLDVVRQSDPGYKPKLKFWLQVGTHDELDDRDQDGIIDAVGDTRDLVRYLIDKKYDFWNDIRYLELANGHHNQTTWGLVLPDFLQWAFGKSTGQYVWGHTPIRH